MDTFKAILCDDNEIILEGLKTQIDWELLGIELSATATDGREALALFLADPCDILIADIRMPFLDGLALAEAVKASRAQTAIIIISGYNDFEYARTAVRLGVVDYLLKPIDPSELTQVLKKVAAQCQRFRLEQQAAISKALLAILHREVERETFEAQCRELLLDPEWACCVVQLQIGGSTLREQAGNVQYEAERRFASFTQRAQEYGVYYVSRQQDASVFFLFAQDLAALSALLDRFIADARREIVQEADYSLTIAVGGQHDGLMSGARSYEESAQSLQLKFIKGVNATIHYEEARDFALATERGDAEDTLIEIDLVTPLKTQDRYLLEQRLALFHEQLATQGGHSRLYMTMMVGNLYSRILHEIGGAGVDIGRIFDAPMENFRQITFAETLDEVMQTLRDNLYRILEYIQRHKGRYSRVIETAAAYIEQHYAEASLSIEHVAAAVYLSTSHFSTIFKAETSLTFTDYLILVRMQKAQERLQHTNEKVYEVSAKVGYDNAAYFSSAFKKHTGLSPSEFKAAGQRGSQD